ncbi:MAG: FeoB-associated Cys-rich membrane protein [Candidatus Ornithospirochaeta sp.]
MNIATLVIAIVILGIAAAILVSLWKKRKNGGGCPSCGSCSLKCSCCKKK